ncbi:ras and ef-hand domain-containing protein [Anaeramoeba ignava]|uniref:Ras and ef-hand domain-containing protein n=1 Tax=Anaeramoeba ignava TaxID=1746090 RepID=A0A9Q0LHA1_ANAIG|nr:ras and ef-hand domain-containing protein [Anaeramoeba ignava]
MVVYDVTNQETFDQVKHWFSEIKSNAPDHVATVLVANKIDLVKSRLVSTESGEKLAKQVKSSYFEVSAKTGDNVSNAFQELGEMTYKAWSQIQNVNEKNTVNFSNKKKDKSGCC